MWPPTGAPEESPPRNHWGSLQRLRRLCLIPGRAQCSRFGGLTRLGVDVVLFFRRVRRFDKEGGLDKVEVHGQVVGGRAQQSEYLVFIDMPRMKKTLVRRAMRRSFHGFGGDIARARRT